MVLRHVYIAAFVAACLSSCAGKPQADSSLKTSFAATMPAGHPAKASDPIPLSPAAWLKPRNPLGLAGRDIAVSSFNDIALANKEVVLSFDDGPVPGKTESILATLDEFGVKATFLMVGEMAQAHPAIAKKVVAEGHSIGSHTFSHPNLRGLSFDRALAEVSKGSNAVAKATDTDASFFRFPYLADNGRLRHMVTDRGMVIMDVQIDSKDYFTDSPAVVASRTMSALHHRGSGIILMHDIHKRTASMLPALLTQLKAEGYKVVHLVYKKPAHKPLVVASLD
ncbi:polysaccharide deacetylase family protein [Agrobacterium sp. rho-13.3]|jgi:peptidoglycan/xylan/chitin deacetylase (PgdA/CDA1 family)|uniref:polysaccharide deacetylase family protein n=1 Tax=Agrobacterium sp. rho-13.3 TaxID=3072980 RepID=UPI002A0C799E|nr:polysaccharide deacetylase family protein [Agrobacterium sp. rho-13.3]MDX8308958.1 polysaccharide deacetylase family protein [Agrobacterium sp. rho-13.3]